MTGVYICKCEHPKSEHKRGQHGCRTPDCGCGQFEADLKASAAAQGVALANGDQGGVPFAAGGAVPVAEVGLGPTSVQLRRVTAERDEALAELQTLRDSARCGWCDGLGVAPAERFGRDGDGAPMVEEDQPCPEACKLPAWLVVERNEAQEIEQALSLARAELEQLRALIARVEQAAGIDPEEDRGVDLADRVQSIRDGRTEAINVLCDIARQRDLLAQHQRWLCEACGARYGIAYTDHPCGPLTPVTVTITRGAPTT